MLSQGVSYAQTHQLVYTKYVQFLYHFYRNKAERKRKKEWGGGETENEREREEGKEGGRKERMRGLHLSGMPRQCDQQHHLQEYLGTIQIKQFKLEMASECEMIQLFNVDCFTVLIKLSVLGSAF